MNLRPYAAANETMKVNTLVLTVLLIGGAVFLMVLVLLIRKCRRQNRRFANALFCWPCYECCKNGCCCCRCHRRCRAKDSSVVGATISKQPQIQIVITSDSNDRFLRTNGEIEAAQKLLDGCPQGDSHKENIKQSYTGGTLDGVCTSRSVAPKTVDDMHEYESRMANESDAELQLNYEHAKSAKLALDDAAQRDDGERQAEGYSKCDSAPVISGGEERVRAANQPARTTKLSDAISSAARSRKKSPDYTDVQYGDSSSSDNVSFQHKVRSNEQTNQDDDEKHDRNDGCANARRFKRVRAFAERNADAHRTIDSGELDICNGTERVRELKRTSQSLVYRRRPEPRTVRSIDTDSDVDDNQRRRVDPNSEESLRIWSMRARLELDEANEPCTARRDSHPEFSALSSIDSAGDGDDRRPPFTPIFEESTGELSDGGLAGERRAFPTARRASFSTDRRELFRALSKKRRQQRDSRAAASSHAQNAETSFESGETVDSTTDSIRPATTTSMESNTASTPDSLSQTNCGYVVDDKQEHDTCRWAVRHNSRRLRVRPVHALESVASCEREAGESDTEDPVDTQHEPHEPDVPNDVCAVHDHPRSLALGGLDLDDLQYSPSRPRADTSACCYTSATRLSPSGRAYPAVSPPDRSNWLSTRSQLICDELPLDYVRMYNAAPGMRDASDELARSPNSSTRRRMLPKLPPRRYDSEVNEEAIEARLATVHKLPAAKCHSINTVESERYSRHSHASDLCPPPPPTPSPSLMYPVVLPRQRPNVAPRYTVQQNAVVPPADNGYVTAGAMGYVRAANDSRRTSPTGNSGLPMHDLLQHSTTDYAAAIFRTATAYPRPIAACDSGSIPMQLGANLTIQQIIARKWSN